MEVQDEGIGVEEEFVRKKLRKIQEAL